VEKYCREGEVKNDNITWHIRFSCWINKTTNKNKPTHTEYVTLINFPLQL